MAYASLMDVAELNTGRATYAANTKPTATQVVSWLEQTAAELDGILRKRGYALPVPTTATGALAMLEHFNALGAHAMVEQGAQATDRREEAYRLWMDAKKMLADGTVELDAPIDSAEGRARYPAAPSPFISRDSVF